MGLTDDQKAMLKLLAQREDGYEDMAAVMGISVEEVRERVKEALAEVDQPAAEAPPEPPPAVIPPPVATPEPTPAELPAEVPPTPPLARQPETKAPAPVSARQRRPAQLPSLKLPKDRGALIGLVAGALVVLIFAVVLIVSGSGGGSDSSTTSADEQGGTTTASENANLTEAVLAPIDGGDASGRALFGRYKKNVLLQVEAEGLDPSPQGESYTVWLYRSPKISLQIGAVAVGKDGKIAAQFQIPPQLLAYVASGAFDQVDVALTDTAEYKAALTKAKSEQKLPPHLGESVLRGEITGPAIKKQ